MQKFFPVLIAVALLPSIADAHERRGRGWYEPYRPHYSARPYDFMYPYGTYQPRRHLHVPPPSGYTTTIYCESWQGNLMVDQHGNYVCVR